MACVLLGEGEHNLERVFQSEDEAYRYFLEIVLADPATRLSEDS